MMYAKIYCWLLTLLLIQPACAQLNDSFSDGDFTQSPPWSGDNTKFTISSGKLKLQAPAVAETAYLSSPSNSIYNASWEFYLQMDFNPSSANYAKIYLVSDQANLGTSLNGYFVKAGNTSRDISLYRQNGLLETRIIDGADDRINSTLVKVKIRVTRSASGQWELFSDAAMSGSFSPEGSVVDATFSESSFCGVVCIYTATRSDKFWFDDLAVTGTTVPDLSPPTIVSFEAINDHQINLFFSEPLDAFSSCDVLNYAINSVNPASADLQSDQRTVQLYFLNALTNGVTFTLNITSVKDLNSNGMELTQVMIMYFQNIASHNKDIIITEIFPDPSPQIKLPSAEFIEIYNRSPNPVDLQGWKISDGSSVGIFPHSIMLPGEYRIVTSLSNLNSLVSYGSTIGLGNFPTLNNDADHIVLINENDLAIDSVAYNLDWYHDEDKQEGGWTLELIDPGNPCGEEDNWTASINVNGGTPGRQNSVLTNKPDLSGPELLSVFPDTPSSISLTFNEKLDASACANTNFFLNPALEISKVQFKDLAMRTILIDWDGVLIAGEKYTLSISEARDCNGNPSSEVSVDFGLPEKPDSADVVINEVLFNPRSGGADFVEVFNRSPRYLNLKKWRLCNFDGGVPQNSVTIFADNTLLAPGSFSVFSTAPDAVKSQYMYSCEGCMHKSSIPLLPDTEGTIAIQDDTGKILDALAYSHDWHSTFIKNDEGISLERISPEHTTNDANNWTSASSRCGFATPGIPNSQHRDEQIPHGDVEIVPEVFSPDDSGADFVQIRYHLEPGGWIANVKVIDQQGRIAKTLATNELLGPEGFFRWGGDLDRGGRARLGYYLVWFEVFNISGATETFRKRVVVFSR